MSRPLRIEFAGALYHVTSRGNAREDIYRDDEDRWVFLDCLARTCDRHGWRCHAYCLMSNHYHLLVETVDATLSKGMKHLNGTYTQRFNYRHDRVGHVLQGRFNGILVQKNEYLLQVARYIVLNPVRAGMVQNADAWPWSSYRATAGMRDAPSFLSVDWLLRMFGAKRGAARQSYRKFVAAGSGAPSPWASLKNQIFLGSDAFVEEMQRQLDPDQPLKGIPERQRRAPPKPLEQFTEQYRDRKHAMAEAYRSGHYTLGQIGAHFGVSAVTVSRAARSFGV